MPIGLLVACVASARKGRDSLPIPFQTPVTVSHLFVPEILHTLSHSNAHGNMPTALKNNTLSIFLGEGGGGRVGGQTECTTWKIENQIHVTLLAPTYQSLLYKLIKHP